MFKFLLRLVVGSVLGLIALANPVMATCPGTVPVNGATADAGALTNYLACLYAPLVSPSFTGNVGIGTATPSTLLNVYQATGGGAPSLTSDANTTFLIGNHISTALAFGNDQSSPFEVWLQTKRTNNDGTAWPLALNPLGGNVGIGTLSPGSLLTMSAAAAPTVNIDYTTTSSFGRIAFTQAGVFQGVINSVGSTFATTNRQNGIEITNNRAGPLGFWTSGTERARFDASGNFGIGTTTPAATLEVNGGIQGDSFANISGSYGFQSATTGTTNLCYGTSGGYYIVEICTSLSQYKKNQRSLSLGLDTLMQLHPVEFDWDAQHGAHHDLGFIAQEVEKVNPLLAEYDYKDSPKGKLVGVKYMQMTALLTKAVQDLKTASDAQATQNAVAQKTVADAVKVLMAQNQHLAAVIAEQQVRIAALERTNNSRTGARDPSRKRIRLGAVNVDTLVP